MLLIPKTSPLTYPKIKEIKDQKIDHFFTFHFSLFTFHFSLHSQLTWGSRTLVPRYRRPGCLLSAILHCWSSNSDSRPNFFNCSQCARRALWSFCFFRTFARTSFLVRPLMLGAHRCPTCKECRDIVCVRKLKFFRATVKRLFRRKTVKHFLL